jgi:transposase-like protein
VHFLPDMESHCAKAQRGMRNGALHEVLAASDTEEARLRLAVVATHLQMSAPKVAALLLGSEEELLAHMAFPPELSSKLRSTDHPQGRRNRHLPQ